VKAQRRRGAGDRLVMVAHILLFPYTVQCVYGCERIHIYGCERIHIYGCESIHIYGCERIHIYGCERIMCARGVGHAVEAKADK